LEYQVDGNSDFIEQWIAPHLKSGSAVYDVGGGKNPIIDLEQKTRFGLRIVGLDIDEKELKAAPPECTTRLSAPISRSIVGGWTQTWSSVKL
jgi:hypothetical protein